MTDYSVSRFTCPLSAGLVASFPAVALGLLAYRVLTREE